MKKYKIINEESLDDLEDVVNSHLAAGWQLWGDLKVIVKGKDKTHWVQAMGHANANP